MVGFLGGTRGSSLGFPPPGGGRGGAFSVRGGVNPTAKNLVALKRRRIRTRDPKSPGKPQQSRGAEVLFQGIFPLARIRARSRGEAAELFRNILNPKRQGVPGPIWQEGFIYSPATGERRGRWHGVAPRRPRPLVAKQWVAGPAAWRSRGFVRPGRGSSVMLDRDERSTSASRAPRWAGPGRASCDVALPRLAG